MNAITECIYAWGKSQRFHSINLLCDIKPFQILGGHDSTSVRGLLVFVVAVGAVLGWAVRGARIQREAVKAIENNGGGAFYDWQWKGGTYDLAS